jgi:prepilin-type N-terminal cleavage/methylation domain-containing protein
LKKIKAFTLVELLAVIAILGIISTLAVTSLYQNMQKSQEKAYNSLIDTIENSASLYFSRHKEELRPIIDAAGQTDVSLTQLEAEGLLKLPVKDPRTNLDIDPSKKVYLIKETENNIKACFDNVCD